MKFIENFLHSWSLRHFQQMDRVSVTTMTVVSSGDGEVELQHDIAHTEIPGISFTATHRCADTESFPIGSRVKVINILLTPEE